MFEAYPLPSLHPHLESMREQPTSSQYPMELPPPIPEDHIVCNDLALNSWCLNLESKTLIGVCHGVRPLVDTLKFLMKYNWESKNMKLPYVQYLPNNFYLFFFENSKHAMTFLSNGT